MNKFGLAIFAATVTAFMFCAYEMGKCKGYEMGKCKGYEEGYDFGLEIGQTYV